jgi:DNA-binding CsgD family transcriptional regulator
MIGMLRGREAELAALAGALTAAEAGTGGLLVVEGPAGIGKTTLLGSAAALGRERGMAVLTARGNPLEQDFSFGIARQAFAPVQSRAAWDELCHGPAALAERVLTADVPAPASNADAMYAAAHGLFWLTANQASRVPTVLCVDDAHWADVPSLRWLIGLVRRVDELPLAVVVAVRTGEPVADPRMLAELLAGATGAALRLRPLGADASAALVRAALPAASPTFARACHTAAGGNPFLLSTLVAHLIAERVTPDETSVAALGTVEPHRVGRWIEQQLRRLPDGTAELARSLAVLGPAASLRHAAALAGVDAARAALLTDAMRAAGILAPGPELVLAHPIVATALYDGLGPGERGLWHARAARLLAADNGDPERAALHLLRAEPAGDGAAVVLLRRAAERANARGAPETAATFLRRALVEPPADRATDAAVRLDLALALAAGRQAGAAELARDVVALIDAPTARADAALRSARALGLAGDGEAAIDLHRLVLDRPDGVPPETLARIQAELAATSWPDSRTRPLAIDMVRRAEADPPPLPLWRVNAAIEATFAGRPVRESVGLLSPVLDAGVLAGETDSLLPTVAGLVLVVNEDLPLARAMSEAVVADARPRGWMSTVAHGRFMRALALLPAGAVAEAEADARAAFEFKVSTTTPLSGILWALYPLVDALVEGDRPEEAEAALRSVGLGDPPAYALTSPLILQSRARLRLVQGRAGEALADLHDAAARWARLEVHHPGFATWRADAVAALLAVDDRAEAVRAAREHLALAERAAAPGPLCAALRAGALVAGRGRRIDLLERAVRVTAGAPARLQHAYALHDLGCALRRANHRTEARGPLRAALDLADAGGATRLAGRALTELHAAGARPRRAALRGTAALTTAEQQVVTLAASGYTNRQIAQRLTLSRRTIETHLAHAYQKLNIRSRTELAGFLTSATPSRPA